MTSAAIMQPTFLPWLGYFALIDAVDQFVFLDDVQFSKQSWQSRNRIKGPDGPVMLSLGVARKPSKPLIHEARLAETGFETGLMKTIAANLGRAPHYDLVADIVARGFSDAGGSLCALNTGIIRGICKAVGISTPVHMASDMNVPHEDTKSGRLIAMCRVLGADTYLSPVGSYDYLADEDLFSNSPVELRFLNYTHPTYPQSYGAFLSHMAAIDALAHVGAEGFLPLVRSGVGPAYTQSDYAGVLS